MSSTFRSHHQILMFAKAISGRYCERCTVTAKKGSEIDPNPNFIED